MHTSACSALRYYSQNTSHLLVQCLSATLSAAALHLREGLRLFLQLKAHPSRRAPEGFPRHVSVDLFDALLQEYETWRRAPYAPTAPPSWVASVADLLSNASTVMPFSASLGDLNVTWSFRIRDFLRPFVIGYTYFAARQDNARSILPQDRLMGPEPPRLNGSTRAALSLTFGLSAPPALFRLGARPLPLSWSGPGMDHPVTLAMQGDIGNVMAILKGNEALRRPPFVRLDKDGKALPPPVPPGTAPPPENWSSEADCALCGGRGSSYHAIAECGYPTVAAARDAIVGDAETGLLPFLRQELRRAIEVPSDGGMPLVPDLSGAEAEALSLLALTGGGGLSNEGQHILYRLVTASPWPKRVAQAGHHLAAALGALFDAVIADRSRLRRLVHRWTRWAHVALEKIGSARLCALEAECRAPTLPRPTPRPPPPDPPPPPPAPPPPPPPPSSAELRPPRGPPLPAPAPPLSRWVPEPAAWDAIHACAVFPAPLVRGDPPGELPRTWFRRCNLAALTLLFDRGRRTPTTAPRIRVAQLAVPFSRNRLYYEELLFASRLHMVDVERLRALR